MKLLLAAVTAVLIFVGAIKAQPPQQRIDNLQFDTTRVQTQEIYDLQQEVLHLRAQLQGNGPRMTGQAVYQEFRYGPPPSMEPPFFIPPPPSYAQQPMEYGRANSDPTIDIRPFYDPYLQRNRVHVEYAPQGPQGLKIQLNFGSRQPADTSKNPNKPLTYTPRNTDPPAKKPVLSYTPRP